MLLALAVLVVAADPVTSVWIRSQIGSNSPFRPEVHSVDVRDKVVIVRSAGLSKLYLGELQARPQESAQQFEFRIPSVAPGSPSLTGGELRGVFTNGVPFYRLSATAASFQESGLWRFDRLRRADTPELLRNLMNDGSRHSPILGYTLEGSPVYGPWGFANADGSGGLRRMRSSYRLRVGTQFRTHWPNGLELTPAQAGPAVGADYPLGTFHEDYVFASESKDLDAWNGRFTRTPEYPQGVYAYFLTAAYPYLPSEPFHAPPFADIDFAIRQSGTEGTDWLIEWKFLGTDGSLLDRLETAHERPVHLMIVSEDLSVFQHVHPTHNDQSVFVVRHHFPKSGKYHLYADFIAPGVAPRIERRTVTISGLSPPPAASDPPWKVALKTPAQPLRAGSDAELRFELPVTDLEPYLGAWAHFAIVDTKQRVFIHAHPQSAGPAHDHAKPVGASPASMIVPVHFPVAGEYKLWAQVQWRGEVRVFPFSVRILEAEEAPRLTLSSDTRKTEPASIATERVADRTAGSFALPPDAIRIDITSEGFSPSRIIVRSGIAKLAFVRSASSPNCGGRVVFPDLGIEGTLQPGTAWVTQVNVPEGSGEIRFACGMGMYRGAVTARVIATRVIPTKE